MDLPTTPVNLADPEDLEVQIKHFESRHAELKLKAADIQRQVEHVDTYLSLLNGLLRLAKVDEVDEVDDETPSQESARVFVDVNVFEPEMPRAAVGVTEKCVELLQNGPMNLTQLHRALKEAGIEPKNRNALNATLYTAARKGRLKRIGSGVYGPARPRVEQGQILEEP